MAKPRLVHPLLGKGEGEGGVSCTPPCLQCSDGGTIAGTDVDGDPSVAKASFRERADGVRPAVTGAAFTLRSRHPNAGLFLVGRISSQ
jgi:hypothetical protein